MCGRLDYDEAVEYFGKAWADENRENLENSPVVAFEDETELDELKRVLQNAVDQARSNVLDQADSSVHNAETILQGLLKREHENAAKVGAFSNS